MKLRKFFGLTSRAVLEQVRAELGPDALIVANRPTAQGIEITALAGNAMDTLLASSGSATAAADPADALPAPVAPAPAAAIASAGIAPAPSTRFAAPPPAAPWTGAPAPASGAAGQPAAFAATPAQDASAAMVRAAPVQAVCAQDMAAPPRQAFVSPADATAASEPLPARIAEEIAAMRTLVEEQIGQLMWSDKLRRSPLRTAYTRDLLAAGYSAVLAREITQRLPDDYSRGQARDWVAGVLARNLRCTTAENDIVTRGGVYALVGPTGVGKTTTTAKLAARCAVRYGAGRLALLTTDNYRVGAQDQLRIYARILGVQVHTVGDRDDLRQALDSLRGKHLVLVDTVGMSQRDERLREQSMLLAQPELKRLLLLNAAAQGDTLEEVLEAYRRPPELGVALDTVGCILTKVDEAGQLGQALDVLIRHHLVLAYTSSGQRVPEDLHEPNPAYLVQRSLRRAAKPSPFTLDDDAFTLVTGASPEPAHA